MITYSNFSNVASGTLTALDILADGNTKAWYDYTEGITNVTGFPTYLEKWEDKGGNADADLGVLSSYAQITEDGISFNGTNQSIQSGTIILAQPCIVYAVLRMDTWTDWDYMCDGKVLNSGAIINENATPKICAYAGSQSGFAVGLTVGQFGIVRLKLNGANSKLIANNGTPVTGNFGSTAMEGVTLGSKASGANFAHVTFKEYICRIGDESTTKEDCIYNWLKDKYGL
jgi:hypothetical protein